MFTNFFWGMKTQLNIDCGNIREFWRVHLVQIFFARKMVPFLFWYSHQGHVYTWCWWLRFISVGDEQMWQKLVWRNNLWVMVRGRKTRWNGGILGLSAKEKVTQNNSSVFFYFRITIWRTLVVVLLPPWQLLQLFIFAPLPHFPQEHWVDTVSGFRGARKKEKKRKKKEKIKKTEENQKSQFIFAK